MDLTKNFYSLSEVRKIVFSEAISLSLLKKLVNDNVIPHERFGGRILIPKYWLETKIKEAIYGKIE